MNEQLPSGYEHLLFYGRLKGLKNGDLKQAVETALKEVQLFYGGGVNKLVKDFSGGMKRRLCVAISLIGSPKVVYLDEPSTVPTLLFVCFYCVFFIGIRSSFKEDFVESD